MKKLYALAFLLAAAFGVQAQHAKQVDLTGAIKERAPRNLAAPAALVDTLLFPGFFDLPDTNCTNSVWLYRTQGRLGFVSGTNQYGDREKLMKYRWAGTGTVVDARIYLGGIKSGGGSSISAVVYGTFGTDGLPDSSDRVLSTARPMRLLQQGYNTFAFANAAIFADSFVVGLVLPQRAGDTVAIYQSLIQSPPCTGPDTTLGMERAADGSFITFADSWGAPFEIVIVPNVRYDDAVSTKSLLTNLVRVHPVPASKNISVSIPDNIKGATTWQILGSDGRVVRSSANATAEPFLQIDRGDLAGGVYTLRLNTVAGPVNKRIIFAN